MHIQHQKDWHAVFFFLTNRALLLEGWVGMCFLFL